MVIKDESFFEYDATIARLITAVNLHNRTIKIENKSTLLETIALVRSLLRFFYENSVTLDSADINFLNKKFDLIDLKLKEARFNPQAAKEKLGFYFPEAVYQSLIDNFVDLQNFFLSEKTSSDTHKINNEVKELMIGLNSLKIQLSEEVKKLENLERESNEIRKMSNEIYAGFSISQKNIDDFLLSNEKRVQSIFTDFKNRQNEELKKVGNFYESIIKSYEKNLYETTNEYKSTSENVIHELNTSLIQAKSIVNAVSDTSITGSYRLSSEAHRKTANVIRIIAIFFMGIMSTILFRTLYFFSQDSLEWHFALIRILATAVLIYPLTYLIQESNKHRNLQNMYRKIELELATLNPFIEFFDDSKKQEIREKLIEKYFSGNSGYFETNNKSTKIAYKELKKLLKILLSKEK